MVNTNKFFKVFIEGNAGSNNQTFNLDFKDTEFNVGMKAYCVVESFCSFPNANHTNPLIILSNLTQPRSYSTNLQIETNHLLTIEHTFSNPDNYYYYKWEHIDEGILTMIPSSLFLQFRYANNNLLNNAGSLVPEGDVTRFKLVLRFYLNEE